MLSKRYESTEVDRRTWLHVKTAWRYFKSYQERKISVINYDHIRSREARKVPPLRAYLWMNYRMDVGNMRKDIEYDITDRLGHPMSTCVIGNNNITFSDALPYVTETRL